MTFPPNTSHVVSYIMGRLTHNVIDNGAVKVHTLYFPVEFNSESEIDPDTTLIKSDYDDEIDRLFELFHS